MMQGMEQMWLSAMDAWSYPVLFLTSLLEPIPFIGLLNPGATVAHAGGFLAQQGTLDLSMVILVCFLGLFVGDLIAYWSGRYFGYPVLVKLQRYFSFDPNKVEQTRLFVQDHVGKALTFGRFIFPIRVFGPFIVGASGCPFWRFAPFSLIGLFVWSFAIVLLGYFLGFGYEAIAPFVGEFFLGALITAVIIGWGFWSLQKVDHVFHKFQVYEALTFLVSVLGLGALIESVQSQGFFFVLDRRVHELVSGLRVESFDPVMLAITSLFDRAIIVPVIGGIIVVSLFRRKFYESLVLAATTSFAVIGTYVLKNTLAFSRPTGAEVALHDSVFGFPSGHTVLATVFFLSLAYVLSRRYTVFRLRFLCFLLAGIGFSVVGFSRIYLGVHWLSDVFGGFAFAAFSMSGTLLVLQLGRLVYEGLGKPKA